MSLSDLFVLLLSISRDMGADDLSRGHDTELLALLSALQGPVRSVTSLGCLSPVASLLQSQYLAKLL